MCVWEDFQFVVVCGGYLSLALCYCTVHWMLKLALHLAVAVLLLFSTFHNHKCQLQPNKTAKLGMLFSPPVKLPLPHTYTPTHNVPLLLSYSAFASSSFHLLCPPLPLFHLSLIFSLPLALLCPQSSYLLHLFIYACVKCTN